MSRLSFSLAGFDAAPSARADEIARWLMGRHPTPFEIRQRFGVSPEQADLIDEVRVFAYGAGGQGFEWARRKIATILRGRVPVIRPSRFAGLDGLGDGPELTTVRALEALPIGTTIQWAPADKQLRGSIWTKVAAHTGWNSRPAWCRTGEDGVCYPANARDLRSSDELMQGGRQQYVMIGQQRLPVGGR